MNSFTHKADGIHIDTGSGGTKVNRRTYYIKSAFSLDSDEKRQQELRSLLKVDDSFQKIVITGSDISAYTDAKGIRFMGLYHFLLSGI